jgi:Protein of unknown function (DUF3099)
VRMVHLPRQRDVTLVADAQRPMSEDIAFRERRYLVMMGIRVLCFVIAIVLFVAHAGWLAAIPAAGAIVIPYFAVVFANGGREPSSTRGLRPYEPNLPERYEGPSPSSSRSATDDSPASSGGGEAYSWRPDMPDDYGAH